MKKLTTILITMVILSSFVFAGESPGVTKNVTLESIVQTLLNAVQSSNKGLAVSSVQMLGEIKSGKAVIPLMRVLKDGADETARIAAALSLYKIGDARGIFAVKQAAKFDESLRVRNLCSKFYNEYKSS